ncbi:MAG: recombination protein RecR [Candidatus Krumholzibacteriota bacterium]|uniref:Recombination protein RecR n=1 Tax=Eiseniibacteriota bacterium TaxID=2212470 RepID=A0A7V2AV73_UNCEI|nr:recombination protein RecR [Candidatus Krumholzibacteriota bacterium]HER43869.1 recombination protein RecR [Candidatus Eisenbacteria bacterium]
MYEGLPPLRALIDRFRALPGIGEKTARRLAFAILEMDTEEVRRFAEALLQVKERIGFCTRCGNLADGELCSICRDPGRIEGILCVVERPGDLYFLENSGQYRGRYHVLHGVLSPLDGVGPEDLNLPGLEKRVRDEGISEVIVATNPNVEGDTTSLYISRMLDGTGVTVTRPARGLPLGSSLEFVDTGTITKALEGRERI